MTAGEAEAWRLVIAWAQEAGLQPGSDRAGNLFLTLPGRDRSLAPVLAGSHLDTQPTGGRFDGAFGVLAALEAAAAMAEAGRVPARGLAVVAWMNEEGSRFAPGIMTSSAEQSYGPWLPTGAFTPASAGLAQAAIGRFEQVIGARLRSRTDPRRATGVDAAVHALNRMLELGRPVSRPHRQTRIGAGATAAASLVRAARPNTAPMPQPASAGTVPNRTPAATARSSSASGISPFIGQEQPQSHRHRIQVIRVPVAPIATSQGTSQQVMGSDLT